MVAGSNAETGPEVVNDRPNSGLPAKRSPERVNATHQGDTDDQEDLVGV